ncbi:Uncharacterised protein [Salmonella enterica subsp. enterica serovar Typhi]|nr:Uncharacterised protein [Salmonella enterica subsp. enterica serovar Typhi]
MRLIPAQVYRYLVPVMLGCFLWHDIKKKHGIAAPGMMCWSGDAFAQGKISATFISINGPAGRSGDAGTHSRPGLRLQYMIKPQTAALFGAKRFTDPHIPQGDAGSVHQVIQRVVNGARTGMVNPDVPGFPVIQRTHRVIKPLRRGGGPGFVIGITKLSLAGKAYKPVKGLICTNASQYGHSTLIAREPSRKCRDKLFKCHGVTVKRKIRRISNGICRRLTHPLHIGLPADPFWLKL